jgi:tetratricopeptide (TPR) repeat protein
LIVFLYDRTFVAGSFRDAWRSRRRYYLCLASTWILLGSLVVSMGGNRGKAAGFDTITTPWFYALTQCKALVRYLSLAFWPHPLVFDYGSAVVTSAGDVAAQAGLLLALLAATVLALRFWPALGFLGAWFFLILAPSSSFLPLASQTMAEHRMYLPLAAVIALALWVWGRVARASNFLVVVAVVAVGLGFMTHRRNDVYRSQVSLWGDTARKCPDNARAQFNLGMAYDDAGRHPEARDQFLKVVSLDPFNSDAHFKLANELAMEGRMGEAIAHFQEAVFLKPESPEIHRNYGNALEAVGRGKEAAAQFAEAGRLGGPPSSR